MVLKKSCVSSILEKIGIHMKLVVKNVNYKIQKKIGKNNYKKTQTMTKREEKIGLKINLTK